MEPRSSAFSVPEVRPCRFCAAPLDTLVVDLGLSPLCQSIVPADALDRGHMVYPLRAYVCQQCWLIQVHDLVRGEDIYSDYAYFSSFSDSWLEHARRFAREMTETLSLDSESRVVEIASNDGYLLKNFVADGIPCYGIEPAANVAQTAIEAGIDCVVEFFGVATAERLRDEGRGADLIVANNVIGHVPDINDFVGGMQRLLLPGGTVSIEIPHAIHLIHGLQFDAIYQEHYSYWLLTAMRKVLSRHGLTLVDVQRLPTHGGSLRYLARHSGEGHSVEPIVEQVEREESAAGLTDVATYQAYPARVAEVKYQLLEFLIRCRREGKQVVGYGAPGKAATLLNYCGIREDLIRYTVDRNPVKQDTFQVGTLIPIHAPEMIAETRPDYIVILPWNLKDEIAGQLEYTRQWGAKFVIPLPELTVF